MNPDEKYMQRALQLAKLGGIHVAPNPLVGAVIVCRNRIIGEGYHQHFGEAHAEVNAIHSVEDPSLLEEATIYITLEPCSHFGKTPPCADLLIRSKFKRVVIAQADPFPEVAGRGIEKLRNAGIQVDCGILEQEAKELNKRFITFHTKKRPFVTLKWAQTSNGFIDRDRSEENKTGINWISQPETQVITHQLRTSEQAILVGWKTVLNDNPSLTARAFSGKNPIRIVIDPELKAPENATLFTDNHQTIVFNKKETKTFDSVHYLKLNDFTPEAILSELYRIHIHSVLVEGGAFTLAQFIESGLWDKALVITGQGEFNSGVKAPVLAKMATRQVQFGKDLLYYFHNYTF
ncbi:bifunctional diaminohydroxyphosphoribosylaminopyrimidine deaminase/5-amino-6-(5-phosphoribosylamino)uracil reductase RibD [Fluviicola sp.]|jgi:diaminohydroxyphosphoribosylaminopyrimidine deaminase/5-amino-6-(5-phosphoribosylamino)uracil reductase|uniref:bifunctional diaminohydroxyphosphoribosylaminopyrimidine deaminase/5-amino-6-(5-phosphoribosylamino)uracil reductase RibD n=1 Tax=Fluviicola sp. TaxID=1917219 RepID=UPI002823DD62|nr:bifunctional diaminohydroxyphosphoribosylaminopyrimidine deaminase/5-amino-6-(5-phosphoribosylamino)uracil reductase RibD [Fluviicola sp.]MDR0803079.1 bifunctional diaminohydroxyphosphoribosylaminopyrimidine deaminase/5-amino-6-(5-phosphoribosylamino)uracil reductase RibD [Fluviicola sp.]